VVSTVAGRTDLPAVLILNMFYSGLGIARDLTDKGMRVIGFSADPTIYGNFTRCCEVRMAPNSQEEPDQLAEMLLRLVNELHGSVIFPTRDADVLLLDRFRNDLAPHYRLAIPSHGCLLQVMNKFSLAMAAERAAIPVPRTSLISSTADLSKVDRQVGFPCVLKPVLAANWRGTESWSKVGARKAVLANHQCDLEREYESLSSISPELLAQQWIPGGADQIVVLGGYVRHGGVLVDYFTARKLIQSPEDFGTGCVVQSEEIPEIIELSRRLFKTLEYEGMAEVEYKYDNASGEYCLIEINTRHWDWHRLGAASDVNLSWVAYCDLIGEVQACRSPRITHAKWIAEDALTLYLLRGLYRRRVRLGDFLRKLSGRRVYAVAAWSDPRPGLHYCFREFLPDLVKAASNRFFGDAMS